MDSHMRIEPRKQLSFCEANIVNENINQASTLVTFIAILDALEKNTKDPVLLKELRSLLNKVKDMTPQEFSQMKADAQQRKLVFPPNYTIGHI